MALQKLTAGPTEVRASRTQQHPMPQLRCARLAQMEGALPQCHWLATRDL